MFPSQTFPLAQIDEILDLHHLMGGGVAPMSLAPTLTVPIEAEVNLPIDSFVRTSKLSWSRFEMGKAVFDGSNGKLALHMELRLESLRRKEVAIDPAES
ncbi:MAG: hypothetical protein ACLP8A_17705 [Methylovirgula sp.]